MLRLLLEVMPMVTMLVAPTILLLSPLVVPFSLWPALLVHVRLRFCLSRLPEVRIAQLKLVVHRYSGTATRESHGTQRRLALHPGNGGDTPTNSKVEPLAGTRTRQRR